MTSVSVLDSPIGLLGVRVDDDALTGVHMGEPGWEVRTGSREEELLAAEVARQLSSYFAGERTAFDLPLRPQGTVFQREVWEALCTIPFAETASYRDIAEQVRRPAAVRAVGQANGRNPISVIVPCHRVIGASGALTGYGGGLDRKQWLLRHEADVAGRSARLPL